MVRVLVVEDVDTMRSLLEWVLRGIPGVELSGSARNVWEARLELSRRRPDLVLLDEILPGESSHELCKDLSEQGVAVLLLTGMENATHPLPPGALGRTPKPSWDRIEPDRARLARDIAAVQPKQQG